jgi:hypothetical protein
MFVPVDSSPESIKVLVNKNQQFSRWCFPNLQFLLLFLDHTSKLFSRQLITDMEKLPTLIKMPFFGFNNTLGLLLRKNAGNR